MNVVVRTVSTALVFALLAGAGEPLNWLLGAAFAVPLAFAFGSVRPTGPLSAFRVILAPWFMLGVLLRAATGSARTIRLLLVRRDWSPVGFLTCRSMAETDHGRDLLALAATTSPGSVVISAEGELRVNSIDADAPGEHCRDLGAWYVRYQRPMAP